MKENKNLEEGSIPFTQLFKFASKQDKILIFIGIISSSVNGASQSLFGLFFGQVIQKFQNSSPNEIVHNCGILAIWFIGAGTFSFLLSCCMMFCWINVGERQTIKFRLEYFKALLRQEVGFYDLTQANEISTQVASECFKIQYAVGEKTCIFIYTISMLMGGLIVSFLSGWQIALVACGMLPIICASSYLYQWVTERVIKKTEKSYIKAGGLAEESISGIKTVKIFNGQKYELNKYSQLIKEAFKISIKFSIFTGLAQGFSNMMFFFDFGVIFKVGTQFMKQEMFNEVKGREYQLSDIITPFLAMMMASFELGQAMSALQAFVSARRAGYNIFKILNRQSKISLNEGGKEIKSIEGGIEFKNVCFSYPNAENKQIISNLSLNIQPHLKTALVGESGSGKSTFIQLIERFYDPCSGDILIDNQNLKELKLSSLRSQIGYVGQEPVLFATSIRENLLYGKNGATEEDLITALKQANAWSFIEKLEKGLDTYVGAQGSQFSGGQKQRISIARAILKNPPILLLDEATSALDRQNEAQIQKTLDEISSNRTTIVIAHRLSTIQNADEIIVIDKGLVVERGTHQQLLVNKSHYYNLVEKQKLIENYDQNQQQLETQVDPSFSRFPTFPTMQNPLTLTENDHIQEESGELLKTTKRKLNIQNSQQLTNLPLIQEESEPNFSKKQNKTNSFPNIDSKDIIIQSKLDSETLKNCLTQRKQILSTVNEVLPSILNINDLAQQREEQQQIEKTVKAQIGQSSFKRLLTYNKKQTLNYIGGICFSILNGLCYPFIGWTIGNLTEVLLNPERSDFSSESDKLTLLFFMIGLAQIICFTFQFFFFSQIGETLTFKIRVDLFNKILKMPLSWFDKPENTSGSLTSKLSQDCQYVNILTSTTLGIQITNISTLASALILAFTADWRTSLVGVSLMPFMVISQAWLMNRKAGFGEKTDVAYRDSTNMINDTACNIRTVYSFGDNNLLIQNFSKMLDKNIKLITRLAIEAGISTGSTSFTLFALYGIVFYAGATFHRDYGVQLIDVFIAIQCLMLGSIGMGSNSYFMGPVGLAKSAAERIFEILDNHDENQISKGHLLSHQLKGEIEFKNVTFKYPSRDGQVLKDLSFTIPKGKKVAFVGPSGAGKSSIIQLIQRFYYEYEGEILLDGINIKDFDIDTYREFFGIVSQEPTLFSGTIKENIVYAKEEATEEQVTEVAKKGNALEFIQQYDVNATNGFNRQVGLKGSQLSGGQKQRIAICRALMKFPKIMLLDEATSALDSQNEQVVQKSLDEIMEGKTCICIAHRLSTIKDSDIIFVMDKGSIMEEGNYQQLIEMKGYFYNLQKGQEQIMTNE